MFRIKWMSGAAALAALLFTACATVPGRSTIDLAAPQVSGGSGGPIFETISVTGFGTVTGRPDMATVTLAVEVEAATIAQAIENSNRTVEAVMQALRTEGIDEQDMQSTSFNVWREDEFDFETGQPTGEQTFHVDSALTVTVLGVDRVSGIIEAGLDAGATNVWGLNYGIDDRAALEAEARALALEDAADRAGQIAASLGVTLGEPVIASELAGGGFIGIDQFGLAREMGGGGGPPLSSGVLDVAIQLDVVYTIER